MKRLFFISFALLSVSYFSSCSRSDPEPDPDQLALIWELEVDGKKEKFQSGLQYGYDANGEVTHYIFTGEQRTRSGGLPDKELYVSLSLSINGGESNQIGSNGCYVNIGANYEDSVYATPSNSLSLSVSETDEIPAGNRWDGTIDLSNWDRNGSSYNPPTISGSFSARNLKLIWEENGIDPSTIGGGSSAPFIGTWTYNLCGSTSDSWVSFCADGTGSIFLAECTGACSGAQNPGSLNPFQWEDLGSSILITYLPATICDQSDTSINGTSDDSEYTVNGNTLSYAGVNWTYSSSLCKTSN